MFWPQLVCMMRKAKTTISMFTTNVTKQNKTFRLIRLTASYVSVALVKEFTHTNEFRSICEYFFSH